MKRRYWPVLLAVASFLVFGSYLAYTQLLIRLIKQQAEVHTRVYSLVQREINTPEDHDYLTTLADMQRTLQATLDIPIVVLNVAGQPVAAANLPVEVVGVSDPAPQLLSDPALRVRLVRYASELEARRSGNKVIVPAGGTAYFGDPRLLAWLRWVPYFQVAAALLLILVPLAVIRSNVRAERERLWAAMARELAHQMGTPLSSLSGWLEVLRLPDTERQELASTDHIADVIAADVDRLERVSRRFELIGKKQRLEPVALGEVVAELERYFRPRLPKLGNGIVLRTRVAGGLPPIEANRVLLVWALENVVKNAIDALGGRGGHILIVARPTREGRLHVNIADDGPGIAPQVRDRIFEPGVSTKAGGWGVGLSLTRRIIEELHGGRVTVRDRARGGTVFDIVLPAAPAPAEAKA
jgi:signal transduction histidine kinase